MADSVYDQSLSIVATQVKALADAISSDLTPEAAVEARDFKWDDVLRHPGVTVRGVSDPAMFAELLQDTNTSSFVGYPMIVCMHYQGSSYADQRHKNIRNLSESIRRYYHHRRRLTEVDVTGVRENSCTVRNGGPKPPADVQANNIVEMVTIIGWFMEPRTT